MIPTDGVKWKLDGVVDSVPPDEGCKALGGEVNNEGWDKYNNESAYDRDETHMLIKWGAITKCYRG